ncbi:MAG: hypothetical protein ACRCUS_08100 [Anaerovoracaceae bacterium]
MKNNKSKIYLIFAAKMILTAVIFFTVTVLCVLNYEKNTVLFAILPCIVTILSGVFVAREIMKLQRFRNLDNKSSWLYNKSKF